MPPQLDEYRIDKRLTLLRKYYDALTLWQQGVATDQSGLDVRSFLNKNSVAVRSAVVQAGAMQLVTIAPPPAIGGMVMQNLDPFHNLFEGPSGMSSAALDCVERAIGVYEHMLEDEGLIDLYKRDSIDVAGAIERALRPSFRSSPPTKEREINDAIENILNAIGIEFFREKESAPVGPKAFVPDFSVPSLDLAIEIKFGKKGHGAAAIQEELSADISAYRTKWKRLLAVVYDVGVIDDPVRMRKDNMKHFGVTVLVIKH